MKELPVTSPVILDNDTCVYCGTPLFPSNDTKEHVIGRRFVPKGKLDGQWNLIVRACKVCNVKKSDLEDDISAITMHTDAWGRHEAEDDTLFKESERKAQKSISRRTGKTVQESAEKIKIKVPFAPGVEFTFNLSSPPQIERVRVYELARMQLMAFFYWITYNRETKKGGFWLGSFFPILESPSSDWGNPVQRSFMEKVVDWESKVIATGADGFFKIAIRRHPEILCWSWAIEWNLKYRIVGFFGEREPTQAIVSSLPLLEVKTITQGPNEYVRYRSEMALDKKHDSMFWVVS